MAVNIAEAFVLSFAKNNKVAYMALLLNNELQ